MVPVPGPDTATPAPPTVAATSWALVRQIDTLVIQLIAAAVAGSTAAHGQLLATLVLPPLVAGQRTRSRAAAIALTYFLTAGTSILSLDAYLRAVEGPSPLFLWLLAAALQAGVWTVAWSTRAQPFHATAALIVSALVPFGFASWAHPWHATGLLFPGTGAVGVALATISLELGVLATRTPNIRSWAPLPRLVGATAVLAAAFSHANSSAPPPSWAGMHTHLGDVFNHDRPFDTMAAVQHSLRTNPADVHVWPESILPHWNEATELFWHDTLSLARQEGKTLVFGSTITRPDPTVLRVRNVAVIAGARERPPIDQRTPIPGVTWHPLRGGGVSPALFQSSVHDIAGRRAAIVICYEQLLAWSYLPLLLDPPDVLVGLANVYWVKHTAIPSAQTTVLHAWGRLLGIPVVEAINQ